MKKRNPVSARGSGLIRCFCTLAAVVVFAANAGADPLKVDDFEGAGNSLGGRSSTYVMAPSRALALKSETNAHGGAKALLLKYDKKDKGGPYDSGSWCGYYTLLKGGPRHFDASGYKSITFWVRGEAGGEDFVVGVADRHWDEVGDSVKSESVTRYLPSGRITLEWQQATIPLSVFMVETKELASIAFCFEGSLFPGGAGKGTVFIDDLKLE